jgi:hypothetical protein
MIQSVKFDAATHAYHDETGRKLPSVTRVIKSAGLMPDHFEKFSNQYAMIRGSLVHRACELDDVDDLVEDKLDPILRPYVESWRKFKQAISCKREDFLAIEERVFHPHYRYAGTLDRRMLVRGAESVVDLKTGSPEKWHSIQTAAYVLTFQKPLKRHSVYLSRDGDLPKVVEHVNPDDARVFLACLTVHNYLGEVIG